MTAPRTAGEAYLAGAWSLYIPETAELLTRNGHGLHPVTATYDGRWACRCRRKFRTPRGVAQHWRVTLHALIYPRPLDVARLRGTQSTVVVLGTSDIGAACAAAGIAPHTHSWGGTTWSTAGWVLHRDGTASLVYQGPNETRGRAAVVFSGPIVVKGEPRG